MDRFTELAKRWDSGVATLPDAVVRIAEDIGGDDVERMQIADALMDQRKTIDALVAALEKERDTLEGIRYDGIYHANSETMCACRDAVDRIDAALALARGGK